MTTKPSPHSRAVHRYLLHGVTLESELEFSELTVAADATRTDIILRIGPTPERLARPLRVGACYQAQPGEMLFWLDGVARFHVFAGSTVVVEPAKGASLDAICHLVRSSPFAAVLLQRELLPLHASAVAGPRGALLLVAGAGGGKSALAAQLWRRGCSVLADDIAVIQSPAGGPPCLLPGAPELRLWPDALSGVGDSATMAFARPGLAKRVLRCQDVAGEGPLAIAGIFLLERGDGGGEALARVGGADAIAALLDATYRPAFIRGMRLERQVFSQVAAVARTLPVVRLTMTAGRWDPSRTAARILEEAAA